MVNVEYFIVYIATLVLATYVIYMIANKIFSINLRIKPLILCACCSLFISCILPRFIIGLAGMTITIAALILCAIVFSYLIACHSNSEELAETAIELAISATELDLPANTEKAQQLFAVIKKIFKTKLVVVNQKKVLPEVIEHKTESDLQPFMSVQSKPPILAMPIQVLEAEAKPQRDYAPPKRELPLTDISSCESLDDLLDYAFIQKDALQLTTALQAFQKAMLLCKENKVAPLIIVEISNIFKVRGQYEQAIQLLSEGRNLPYLLENRLLNQQFIEMIAFLRIIKNDLLANQLGLLPYDQIPSDIMLKINKEFRDWLTINCTKSQSRRIIKE